MKLVNIIWLVMLIAVFSATTAFADERLSGFSQLHFDTRVAQKKAVRFAPLRNRFNPVASSSGAVLMDGLRVHSESELLEQLKPPVEDDDKLSVTSPARQNELLTIQPIKGYRSISPFGK